MCQECGLAVERVGNRADSERVVCVDKESCKREQKEWKNKRKGVELDGEKEKEGEERQEGRRDQQKGKKRRHETGSEKEVDIAVGLKKDIVYMVDKDSQSISAVDLRTGLVSVLAGMGSSSAGAAQNAGKEQAKKKGWNEGQDAMQEDLETERERGAPGGDRLRGVQEKKEKTFQCGKCEKVVAKQSNLKKCKRCQGKCKMCVDCRQPGQHECVPGEWCPTCATPWEKQPMETRTRCPKCPNNKVQYCSQMCWFGDQRHHKCQVEASETAASEGTEEERLAKPNVGAQKAGLWASVQVTNMAAGGPRLMWQEREGKAGTEDLKELRGRLEGEGGQREQQCQDENDSEDMQCEFDLREALRRGVMKERESLPEMGGSQATGRGEWQDKQQERFGELIAEMGRGFDNEDLTKVEMWQEAETWTREKVIPWAKMARKERGEDLWKRVAGKEEVQITFTGMQVNTREEGRQELEKIGIWAEEEEWSKMRLRIRREKSARIIMTVVELQVRANRGLKLGDACRER